MERIDESKEESNESEFVLGMKNFRLYEFYSFNSHAILPILPLYIHLQSFLKAETKTVNSHLANHGHHRLKTEIGRKSDGSEEEIDR